MALLNLILKWETRDAKFNMALRSLVQGCNHNFDYLQSRENVAQLSDTDETHALSFKWNEDETLLNRTLNLKVHAADRTIDLQGNLTVESASILNQDLSTDATPRFAKLGLGMDATNVLDVTGNGNVTGTFGVGGNTTLSGTLSAGNSTLGTIGCGTITSTGNVVIQNTGTIGSVGDTDAIAIAADGKATFSQDLTVSEDIIIGNAKYIGSVGDPDAVQIETDGDVVLTQDLGVTGTVTSTSYIIGANTLDTNEWAFLDGQDQAVKTSDSPTFVAATLSQAAGTKPLTITSTTVNTNLNSDLWDDQHLPALSAGSYLRNDGQGLFWGAPGATGTHRLLSGTHTDTSEGTGYNTAATSPQSSSSVKLWEGGGKQWTDWGNVLASDDSRVTCLLEPDEFNPNKYTTQYLKAYNFGFNIAADKVIKGIKVEIEKSKSGVGVVEDKAVMLWKSGVGYSHDLSLSGGWGSTDAYAVYGGVDDLWGLGWTYAEINAVGFAVVIAAYETGGTNDATARVDHIRVTIYYADTIPPVLGDTIYGDDTPKWNKLSGNTTTTRKYLSQTGDGDVSAAPTWQPLLAESFEFEGASGANQMLFPDNLADALSFKEGANAYMTFVSTNNSEAVKVYKDFSINMNSDVISIAHDGSDAYFKTSDGSFTFLTDEATNTNTLLHVKGKGTGYGRIRVYDADDAEWLNIHSDGGIGYIGTVGTSPSDLRFQDTVAQNVTCWSAISSGNPSFTLYGWNTAGGDLESTSLTMDDTNDEFLIQSANSANHEGVTVDLLETNQRFRVRQNSDIIELSHDGTNAWCKWSDGYLGLQTDEGTNTNSNVYIEGKGTGVGTLSIFGSGGSPYALLTSNSLRCVTAPLNFQYAVSQSITCFSGITSGNPYLYQYGFKAADAVKYLRSRVEADGDALIEAEQDLNIRAGGGDISFGDENLVTTGTLGANVTTIYDSGASFCTTYLRGDHIALRKITHAGGGWARNLLQFEEHDATVYTMIGCYGVNDTFGHGYIGEAYNDVNLAWDADNNVGIGTYAWGTNARRVLAFKTSVAPTTSPADQFQMYSADRGGTAGKSGCHIRGEDGTITAIGDGVWINETLNAKCTLGLTINQAGNDDEILALKSSDVGHGFLDFAETDTYGQFLKETAASGGLEIRGLTEANKALFLSGLSTTDDTNKGNAASAPIVLDSYKTDGGTGVGGLGADANLVVMREAGSTRWQLDEDGDTWQDGTCQADTFVLQTGLTPNLDWIDDVDIDAYITPSLNCLLAYSPMGDWSAAYPEYEIKWVSDEEMWEFKDATPPSPWAYGTLNAGTVAITSEAHHPGIATIDTRFDGDASDSGYYFIAANNALSVNGYEQIDFCFRTHTPLTGVRFRLGYQDSTAIAAPNDGIYFEVAADATLRGTCMEATSSTNTGTTYTLLVNTWYRARAIINTDATAVTFRLYTAEGSSSTLLWEQEVTNDIPTAADYVGFGVIAWLNFDDNSQSIISIDRAEYICCRGLER